MTNKAQIIDYTKRGFSPQQIQELMPTVSMSYIYKVRSELKKKSPNVLRTELQRKIDKMKHSRLTVAEIADKLGCSTQYVYRVIAERVVKKEVYISSYREDDEYFTPLYAIKPLEKYLARKSTIWCPFDTDESLFVRYFKQQGHKVINTHIDYGQDFFHTEAPESCDYIISNPPFSLKTEVFERLITLGKPFAMLVSIDGIFAAKKRFAVLQNEDIELMTFPVRVGYLKGYSADDYMGPSPFASGYICKGVLPKQIMLENFDRSELVLQVLISLREKVSDGFLFYCGSIQDRIRSTSIQNESS